MQRSESAQSTTNARREHGGFISEHMTAVAQFFDFFLQHWQHAASVALDIGAVLIDRRF